MSKKGKPFVAPFTGAWIEIYVTYWPDRRHCLVAPFTGAWIEMPTTAN